MYEDSKEAWEAEGQAVFTWGWQEPRGRVISSLVD